MLSSDQEARNPAVFVRPQSTLQIHMNNEHVEAINYCSHLINSGATTSIKPVRVRRDGSGYGGVDWPGAGNPLKFGSSFATKSQGKLNGS